MTDRPLAKRLRDARRHTKRHFPEFELAYSRFVQELKARKVGRSALRTGDAIPHFSLTTADGALVSSADLLANGPLVLSFYRGLWCRYCCCALDALGEAEDEIRDAGGQIVTVSAETGGRGAQAQRSNLKGIQVLYDADMGVSLAFGLVFLLNAELKRLYKEDDLDFLDIYGNDSWFLPIPATYVISQDGVIRAHHVDPDFRNRFEPADIVKAIRALREIPTAKAAHTRRTSGGLHG